MIKYYFCLYIYISSYTLKCTVVNNNIIKIFIVIGTLILITSPGSDRDILWCLSNDAFPFHQYMTEMQTIIPLDGVAWALAEVKPTEPRLILPTAFYQIPQNMNSPNIQAPVMTDPPLVVRQHMEAPRKFVVLTQQVST